MFRVFWSESGSDSCARGLEPPEKVTQERDVAGEDRKGNTLVVQKKKSAWAWLWSGLGTYFLGEMALGEGGLLLSVSSLLLPAYLISAVFSSGSFHISQGKS